MRLKNIKYYYPFSIFFRVNDIDKIIEDLRRHNIVPLPSFVEREKLLKKIENTNLIVELYYGLYFIINRIIEFFTPKLMARRIKRVYHYIQYGVPDRDTWALYAAIAKYSRVRIKRLRTLTNSFPPDLTPEDWEDVLKKIEWSFWFINYRYSDYADLQHWAQCQEGLDLFHEHFFDLGW